MDKKELGKSLRDMRNERNLTQKAVASALDIKQANISRWEAGLFLPTLDICVRLAEFYGCTLDELAGRDR